MMSHMVDLSLFFFHMVNSNESKVVFEQRSLKILPGECFWYLKRVQKLAQFWLIWVVLWIPKFRGV